jgi:hypothetical protein
MYEGCVVWISGSCHYKKLISSHYTSVLISTDFPFGKQLCALSVPYTLKDFKDFSQWETMFLIEPRIWYSDIFLVLNQ